MTPSSKRSKINNNGGVVEKHANKYSKWTIIAFSGDLKHWIGKSKGKPKFGWLFTTLILK